MTEDELEKSVANLLHSTQTQFDNVKLTVGTAGLIVALNLNSNWQNKSPLFLHHSLYKLTLLLDLLSMLTILLGFLVREISVKRYDKLMAGITSTRFENFMLRVIFRNNAKIYHKLYRRRYVAYAERLVTFFNFAASIILMLAIISFMLLVIKA